MLYKFKSKAAGDLIMLEPNGRRVLEIIGKDPAPKGIIESAQMAGDRPAGPSRPNHELASKPLRLAACSTVGTPGSDGDGWALVTASALIRPDLINCIDDGRLSNMTSMSPDTRLRRAGPDPVNG